jgi:hypothetical protein
VLVFSNTDGNRRFKTGLSLTEEVTEVDPGNILANNGIILLAYGLKNTPKY